jgi:hypothetical protein
MFLYDDSQFHPSPISLMHGRFILWLLMSIQYVVDASDESGLAWAHTEYLRVIRHEHLIGKPILVVFNKM